MKATAKIPQYTQEQMDAMTDEQVVAWMNRKFVVKYPSGYEQGLHYETSELEKATQMGIGDAYECVARAWKTRRVKGEILLIVE